MFNKILLPTDGSEMSAHPIAGAIEVARKLGSKVVGMTVVEPYTYAPLSTLKPESYEDYEARVKKVAQERLSAIEEAGEAAGVEVETKVSQCFNPYEAIIATAEENGCEAIFMASHGRRGMSAVLLGSEKLSVSATPREPPAPVPSERLLQPRTVVPDEAVMLRVPDVPLPRVA